VSWLTKMTGMDGKREKKQAAANLRDWGTPGGVNELWRGQVRAYQDPTQGMDQLSTLIRSQMDGAMPQLHGALQGVRENAIARGMSTGDLGTSMEGDVVSAFQRNLATAIAPQVFGLYQNNRNTFLDMLSGQMDRDDTNRNAKKNREAALWGAGIDAAGSMLSLGFGGG